MMGRQNEMEQEIEFQPFNGTPSSRVVNNTTLTRTFYTPTSGIIYACVIVLLLFSNCILLGRVASGIQGTNSELQVQKQILQNLHLGNGTSFYYTPPSPSPPPPLPHSPPPPSPPPPLQENVEYKTVVWDAGAGANGPSPNDETAFAKVMEREGVLEDTLSDCSYTRLADPESWLPWLQVNVTPRTCVLKALVDNLAKENWRLINEPQYWNNIYSAVTFTRTTYTV